MEIAGLLRAKSGDVCTAVSKANIFAADTLLSGCQIGTLVVLADGRTLRGLVSERDVVRRESPTGRTWL